MRSKKGSSLSLRNILNNNIQRLATIISQCLLTKTNPFIETFQVNSFKLQRRIFPRKNTITHQVQKI